MRASYFKLLGVHLIFARSPVAATAWILDRAASLKILVQVSVGIVSVKTGFLGACPPCTDIKCTANINKCTCFVHTVTNLLKPLFVMIKNILDN